ncbi:MAG: hypothetical protein HYV07_15680 [Deltaproteobacteria bacterium]|nr:hypothetical protein [Deltaproteobacteria bacterium]
MPWFLDAARASWALGLTATLLLEDPARSYPAYLGLSLVSAVGWLAVLRSDRPPLPGFQTITLLLWALALTRAPAFSMDAARYVFEGRAVWYKGPTFPFRVPPAEAPGHGLPSALFDELYTQINHPELRTIYPPLAQLVFALAGGLGELVGSHLLWLRLFLSAAAIGGLAVMHRLAPRSNAWTLLGCPILITETAREGHADSLTLLGLALFAGAFASERARLGHVGLGLSALSKLQGAILWPLAARSSARGAILGAGIASGVLLPLAFVGPSALEGLSAYASRWRAGDGAFSLLLRLSELLIGGDHRFVATLGHTLTRHELARAMAGCLFVVAYAQLLRQRREGREVPRTAGVLLLLLLLLSPTLHPWYTTWLLAFVPFMTVGRRSALLLLAAAPLLHHPSWLAATRGQWQDLGMVRALVHLPAWTLLAIDLVPKKSSDGEGSPHQPRGLAD